MKRISATIICFNEAKNIKACLDSVKWVDEIILVDQFSTDGTADIARDLGAVVFQESWKGFAAQKNSAISKASGKWILSLDADERITPMLEQEIENIIKKDGPHDGYWISRKNYFCGQWIRHAGWYPDRNLRLFRRASGCFEERVVHEKVLVNGTTGMLKTPMDHYTYVSVSDYLKRLDRYSRLAALEMAGNPKNGRWHKLSLRPMYTFFNMYVLRGGFMDGWAGFFLAVSYAYYNFLKYYRFFQETLEEG